MSRKHSLPADLFATWDWTEAGGEIATLASLDGKELETYVAESAANAIEHGCRVTASDLRDLAAWLRSHPEVRS